MLHARAVQVAPTPGKHPPPSLQLGAVERWYATTKRGLLGVLFVMSNDVSETPWRAWFIVLFHMLQVALRGDFPCDNRWRGGGRGWAFVWKNGVMQPFFL